MLARFSSVGSGAAGREHDRGVRRCVRACEDLILLSPLRLAMEADGKMFVTGRGER